MSLQTKAGANSSSHGKEIVLQDYPSSGWLWKRAFLMSTAIALLIVAVIAWYVQSPLTGAQSSADPQSSSVPSTQFGLVDQHQLELTYHDAWQAVGQNFYDQSKLSDWKSWEHRFDGKLKTETQLQQAIDTMLASLGDKHSKLLTESQMEVFEQSHSGKFVGIGIQLSNFRINGVLPDSPAKKAGLQAGDVITEVDGQPVGGLTPEQLVGTIRNGTANTTITLTVKRKNAYAVVKVNRGVLKVDPAVRYHEDSKTVAAVRIDNLRSDTILGDLDKALDASGQKPGMLLDLRGLKGGASETAVEVAARFLSAGTITTATKRVNGKSQTVTYLIRDGKLVMVTAEDGKTPVESVIDSPVNTYTGKLVILVDEQTCGAAEVITAALQGNHRATVVGVQTKGKASGQVTVNLSRNFVVTLTNAYYFGPYMQTIDSVGIKPDVQVDPSDAKRTQRYGAAEAELLKQLGK